MSIDLIKELNEMSPQTSKIRKNLKEEISKLYPDLSFKEAASLIILGMDSPPVCKYCSGRISFVNAARAVTKCKFGGWNDICNDRTINKCVQRKMEETSLERFGSKHHLSKDSNKREDSFEKRKKTNREKYGVDFVLQNEEIQKKAQEGIRERNGGYHYMQKEANHPARDKAIAHSVFSNPDRMNQIVTDRFNTTGYAYPTQNPEVREKVKSTWIKNYGADNPSKSEKIVRLIREASIRKHVGKHKHSWFYEMCLLDNGLYEGEALKQLIENHIEIGRRTVSGISFDSNISQVLIKRIAKENPNLDYLFEDKSWRSSIEVELFEFVKTLDANVESNDRKFISPYEIDIISHDQKIAIEVNGTFHHSETYGGKDKNYHISKTTKVNEKGYKLFHFTDFQLNESFPIIQSMLRSAFQKSQTKIYARDCILKEITVTEANNFFYKTHIQGASTAENAFGLFYNEELVFAMSTSKTRKGSNKKYSHEIVRVSSKLNCNVVGGFSRCWNKFIEVINPESVICYQDRRYGGVESNAYRSVMILEGITDPSWEIVHVRSGITAHRGYASKERLQEDLKEKYNPEISVYENLLNNGYDRIWNVGNFVWVYERK